jgi:hypothetical protein
MFTSVANYFSQLKVYLDVLSHVLIEVLISTRFRGQWANCNRVQGDQIMFMRMLAALAAILLLPIFAGVADARPKKRSSDFYSHAGEYENNEYKSRRRGSRGQYRSSERSNLGYSNYASSGSSYGGGRRPSEWCGWWMRTQRGGGPKFNVAWNWRNYGSPAAPQVGAVVVWRHHVGQIVGRASDGRWLVQSGNDGGRVRTRPRSIAGALIRM